MYAHPVNTNIEDLQKQLPLLAQLPLSKTLISDELHEIKVKDFIEEEFLRVVPEVNQDSISFGEGWNIVRNLIIQDI